MSSVDSSIEADEDSKNGVPFTKMAKPLLEIWEGSGDNPFQTVDLGSRDSRRYIRARVNNMVVTYDSDGRETSTPNYYPLI